MIFLLLIIVTKIINHNRFHQITKKKEKVKINYTVHVISHLRFIIIKMEEKFFLFFLFSFCNLNYHHSNTV